MDIAKMEADFLRKKAANEIFDINFCLTSFKDDVLSEYRPTPEEALKKGFSALVLTDTLGMTEGYRKANASVLEKACFLCRSYRSARNGPRRK